MDSLQTFGLAAGAAAAASFAACWAVAAAGVWDAPNEARKAHVEPTPTSGGLGIAIGCLVGLCALGFAPAASVFEGVSPDAVRRTAAALGLALALLVIGFLDDVRPLGPRLKAVLFVGVALAAPIYVARADALPIGAGLVIPMGVVGGVLGSALWMFTIANAVNFMDGANGLAMGSSAVGLAGLAGICFSHGAPHAGALAICGCAALAGFLVWNYPAGRLFAGDAGALFVGGVIGAASLLAIQDGGVSAFIPPILFFPLLADVLLTLAWRARHRSKILTGHRDHLYQIALRAGMPHWKISLIYWTVCANCAVLAFVLSHTPAALSVEDLGALASRAGAPDWQRWLVMAAAAAASSSVFISFCVLAFVSLRASSSVRRFAKGRGLDGE